MFFKNTQRKTFLIKLAINVNALANYLIRKGGRRTRKALLSSLASRGQMLCDTVCVCVCVCVCACARASLGLHPLTPSLTLLSSYLLFPIPSPTLLSPPLPGLAGEEALFRIRHLICMSSLDYQLHESRKEVILENSGICFF